MIFLFQFNKNPHLFLGNMRKEGPNSGAGSCGVDVPLLLGLHTGGRMRSNGDEALTLPPHDQGQSKLCSSVLSALSWPRGLC